MYQQNGYIIPYESLFVTFWSLANENRIFVVCNELIDVETLQIYNIKNLFQFYWYN